MKITMKIDPKFNSMVDSFRKNSALLIATIVWEEFQELLWNAPQRSGNYVANMAIQTGSSSGRKGGELVYPVITDPQQFYKRGDMMPAINYAMNENEGFVARATKNIIKGAGWLDTMTVYNRLDYAEAVESMEKLREENAGGEHAMKTFADDLQARFNMSIPYREVM